MNDRIRADTEKLKIHSKNFETSAGVFAQAGKEILALASGLPSYDGQLSSPARAAALEINRQCQGMHGYYAGDAQSLVRTAQAFETVDNQTIRIIGENLTILQAVSRLFGITGKGPCSLSLDVVVPREGRTDTIAYEEDENTVALWIDGKLLIINKKDPRYLQWKTRIEDYRKAEQEFNADALKMITTLHELINRTGILLAAVLAFPMISAIVGIINIGSLLKTALPELFAVIENPFFKGLFGGASGLLGALSIKDYVDLTQNFEDAADEAKKHYDEGKNIWDQLNDEFGKP